MGTESSMNGQQNNLNGTNISSTLTPSVTRSMRSQQCMTGTTPQLITMLLCTRTTTMRLHITFITKLSTTLSQLTQQLFMMNTDHTHAMSTQITIMMLPPSLTKTTTKQNTWLMDTTTMFPSQSPIFQKNTIM